MIDQTLEFHRDRHQKIVHLQAEPEPHLLCGRTIDKELSEMALDLEAIRIRELCAACVRELYRRRS